MARRFEHIFILLSRSQLFPKFFAMFFSIKSKLATASNCFPQAPEKWFGIALSSEEKKGIIGLVTELRG